MNNKQNINDELLRDIINDIIEMANDTNKEVRNDFVDGKMLAYNEILSSIKTYLTLVDPAQFGLDFDIDEKFG